MADLNYVSPLTSDLTDYYTKTEVDELQQGDAATYATSAQVQAGDNAVKNWVDNQGFLTQHQSLANYATKEYVDEAIEDIEVSGVSIEVVNALPSTQDAEENVIYLVLSSSSETGNIYDEWIYVPAAEDFEMIGNTAEGVIPDLTNYATKSYVDAAIPDVSDFIDAEEAASIAADEVEYKMNTLATVAASGDYDDLINKPTIPSLTGYATTTYVDDAIAAIDIPDVSDFITAEDLPDVSDMATETWVSSQGYLTQHQDISGKANAADLATVATSGSYNDLSDKPTIPSTSGLASETYVNNAIAAIDIPDVSGFVEASDLATVATTGDYDDLTNKPTIPSVSGLATETYVDNAVAAITVPTSLSDLDNDMNFVDEGMAKALAIDEINNNVSAAGLSGSYDDLSNKPTIPTVPTNVSSFTNDAGYLTSHQDISGKVDGTVVSGTTTAKIFNEADGGGAQIITASARGFAGVHDGSNPDATYATMYVKNAAGTSTLARVDLDGDGKAYYLKNGASKATGSEIAVKGDIPDVSSFITSSDLPDLSGYALSSEIPDVSDFITANDLPDTSIYAETANLATVATSGDYDDLTNKPTIPSISGLATETYVDTAVANISVPANTSDLINDSGFITSSDLPDTSGFVESSDLATVATTGDYSDLINKPTIPSFDAKVRTYFPLENDADLHIANKADFISALKMGSIIKWNSSGTITLNFPNDFNEARLYIIQLTSKNTYNNAFLGNPYEEYTFPANSYLLFCPGVGNSRGRMIFSTDISYFTYWIYNKYGSYSNTTSGLTATTIQGAIDELAAASGSSSGITVQDVLDAVVDGEFEASDENGNTVNLNTGNFGYTNETENNGETTAFAMELGSADLWFSKSVDDGNDTTENSFDIIPNFDDGVLQVEIDGNDIKTIAFVEDLDIPDAVEWDYDADTYTLTLTGINQYNDDGL